MKIATPLTNLLKKSLGTYKWDETCNDMFETLKGILVKYGGPVAFESKKLSETQQRWPTHEKEMWVVIHCLKTWGHYIGSKDVVVWIDNVTLKYFATQPKLSLKQVRWQNTLSFFNVDI
jgi:hypothetical protein